VFDHSNEVVAALSVAGPLGRLDDESRPRLIDQLDDIAAALSERLGQRSTRRAG
jgi:DNA-binding IclR family transcriptional regulator